MVAVHAETVLRPQLFPVPLKIIVKLLPLFQPARLTISCTTGAISVIVYQVLAAHKSLALYANFWAVKLLWDGLLVAEKTALLEDRSPAILKETEIH